MSVLRGIPRSQLQAWLTEAVAAYAELMSGAKVVSASYAQGNGNKAVTFTQTDSAKLQVWIMQLQQALGLVRHPRRPMRPYFQ